MTRIRRFAWAVPLLLVLSACSQQRAADGSLQRRLDLQEALAFVHQDVPLAGNHLVLRSSLGGRFELKFYDRQLVTPLDAQWRRVSIADARVVGADALVLLRADDAECAPAYRLLQVRDYRVRSWTLVASCNQEGAMTVGEDGGGWRARQPRNRLNAMIWTWRGGELEARLERPASAYDSPRTISRSGGGRVPRGPRGGRGEMPDSERGLPPAE
ncbi:hypothetical protein [Chromobacterium haemolyticum]|uniref:hypothetical protein n=1 Tax=Chromobacterium haemolyticum TaxID=394935 RepID=UPI0009D9A06A|nr:hypothetical protein [Chromobacterium haemolyticum]OQS43847.1 hypothetical protein B0T39_02455 [Chromobacterium haemolyticum]